MDFFDQLHFLNPNALWLFVLIPLTFIFLKTKMIGTRKLVLRGLASIRSLTITLLVLAISNPSIIEKKDAGGPHFFVGIDGSMSVPKEVLQDWLEKWRVPMKTWEINNAGKLSFFRLADTVEIYKHFDELIQSLDKSAINFSRLSDGLRELERSLNDNEYPVFVLVSDANETENINQLKSFIHKPLYLGVTPVRKASSISIKDFSGPEQVLKGRNFQLKGLVFSDMRQNFTVELLENDSIINSRELNIDRGYSFIDFDHKSEKLGNHIYKLRMRTRNDQKFTEDIRQLPINIYQPNTALIIGEKANSVLKDLLMDVGFTYEYRTPEQIDLKHNLENYSFILIDNVKSEKLSPKFQEKLEQYVFTGGGLGMLGGLNSFGLGGYYGTPLEQALPVYMPPRSYRKSLAVVFIIDSSGSMLGQTNKLINANGLISNVLQTPPETERPIFFAKESAKRVIKSMRGVDVGVVSFNNSASLVAPIQKVTEDNTDWFMDSVDSIFAGGGTKFYPALKGAMTILSDQSYEKIEFIFLSDGAPSDWSVTQSAMSELKEKQIRLSTIAFGVNADKSKLLKMAEYTGGNFFESDYASSLSKVFDEAAEKVFGPPVVMQEMKIKWVPQQNFIEPIPINLPNVLGYVATSPKDRGQVVLASERGDPILSVWNYGLGHSFAWTPDLTGRWSRDWLNSKILAKLFSRAFQKISKIKNNPYKIKTTVNGNNVSILLSALEESGDSISDLEIKGSVESTPDKKFRQKLHFKYLGDGNYRTEFTVKNASDYEIDLQWKRSNETRFTSKKIPLRIQNSYELNFERHNEEFVDLIRKIDERRIIDPGADLGLIFNDYKTKQKNEFISFSLLFLGLAIFLLCIEVLFRRFRVLEELQADASDPSLKKFERMAAHSLKLARESLKKGDNSAAENFYLSAHRYLKQVGSKQQCQAIWEEYRIKVK